MKRVFAVTLLCISFYPKDIRACTTHSSIVYSNGMLNDRLDAMVSLLELKTRIDGWNSARLPGSYHLAYNRNENIFSQAVEVFLQKNTDEWDAFWDFLGSWLTSPDWLIAFSNDSSDAINEASYALDEDLRGQLDLYESLVSEDKNILVVAHSQGNFYANRSFEALGSDQFRILALATPTSTVKGGGHHITSENDWVINSVRIFYPATLDANIKNRSDDGIAGHPFVDSYLDGDGTGPMIKDSITRYLASPEHDCQ